MERKRIDLKRLSPHLRRVLYSIGKFADSRSWNVFCVGGSVRDLLLGRKNFDLDILVEEHGLEFARSFARNAGGTFKLYRRFATAMVILPGAVKVDVTTTRREHYPEPGSLPEIIPGSLEEDLLRRDFTINALAFSLNKKQFGQLIDLSGGIADLESGVIRVLHEESFRDDPTRVFRAVRFQQRLGFTIEPRTEELMKTAVDLSLFEKVSPERLRHELELIFEETDPPGAIESMARYDELRFIHPRLIYSEALRSELSRLKENYDWFRRSFPAEDLSNWRLYFGALIYPLSIKNMGETGKKFNLSRRFLSQLIAAKRDEPETERILSSPGEVPPSRIYSWLWGRAQEIILIMLSRITSRPGAGRIRRYLTEFRKVTREIGGEDIKRLGLSPGPAYAMILEQILTARMDGKVKSREAELRLARRLVDKVNRG